MKEVGGILRKKYYDKLTSLSYGGSALRVYDEIAPTGAASPYILLSTQTEQEISSKDCFLINATILIECISYGQEATGKRVTEELGRLLLENVITASTSNYLNLGSEFKLVTTRLLSTNTITEPDQSRVYYRKLYRIEHKIEQL